MAETLRRQAEAANVASDATNDAGVKPTDDGAGVAGAASTDPQSVAGVTETAITLEPSNGSSGSATAPDANGDSMNGAAPPVVDVIGSDPSATPNAKAELAESYERLSLQFELLTGKPLPRPPASVRAGTRRKRQKLTPQQLRLVKNLTKGMSITDAAIVAGYSDSSRMTAGQCGSQALEAVRRRMPDILVQHGLTDDVLIEKYLKPLLNAKETKFFHAKVDGKTLVKHDDGTEELVDTAAILVETRDVAALGTRTAALDMALKLGDKYPAPKLAVRAQTDSFNLELEVVGGQ